MVQGASAILFGQFFTICAHHQRCVHTQCALQQNLSRRVVGQIDSTHTVCDALRGVIHHYPQLVGKAAIGALQDEVPYLAGNVLLLQAESPVLPLDVMRLNFASVTDIGAKLHLDAVKPLN